MYMKLSGNNSQTRLFIKQTILLR